MRILDAARTLLARDAAAALAETRTTQDVARIIAAAATAVHRMRPPARRA